MFINLSNHPSSLWDNKQLEATGRYGQIVDLPYPDIPADADEGTVVDICNRLFERITSEFPAQGTSIHIMGEMTSAFYLVRLLQKAGFSCLASTTRRDVRLGPDGEKIVRFGFVRFRRYSIPVHTPSQ